MKHLSQLSISYLKKVRQKILRKIKITGKPLSDLDQQKVIDINVELSLR